MSEQWHNLKLWYVEALSMMAVPDDKAMYEYRELSNPVSVFWDGASSLINEILPDGSMKSSA